jgi:hypothetical protein
VTAWRGRGGTPEEKRWEVVREEGRDVAGFPWRGGAGSSWRVCAEEECVSSSMCAVEGGAAWEAPQCARFPLGAPSWERVSLVLGRLLWAGTLLRASVVAAMLGAVVRSAQVL